MKLYFNNRVSRCMYALVFALCSCIAVAHAGASKGACDFTDAAVTYKGAVLPGFGKALDFYQVDVQAHSAIDYATKPKPFDLSGHAAIMRFYYSDTQGTDVVGDTEMTGCFKLTDAADKEHMLSLTQGVNGNNGTPEVYNIFAHHLGKGVGDALFLVMRWKTHSFDMGGYLFRVYIYTIDRSKPGAWVLKEQGHLENEVDDSEGFEGTRESKTISYPYKNKERLFQRLRELDFIH